MQGGPGSALPIAFFSVACRMYTVLKKQGRSGSAHPGTGKKIQSRMHFSSMWPSRYMENLSIG